MSAMDDMHDDEVRARLGLAPLGRPMTMEERITMLNLQSMPEPFDPETEIDLAVADVLVYEDVTPDGTLLCQTPISDFQRMSTSESEPCGTPITRGIPCRRCGRVTP
ncbi:hypothetical protein SEA_FUNSIZED_68 [Mycobacterium phage Funsized]|nr:hypothetical protein SEA_FUNSIZED_68 [Mycobacterium phage Funsized]